MKLHNLYYLIVMMIMTMFVSSCTAESELDKEPEESARYYVKYEVDFATQHTNTEKIVTFQTETGPMEISFTEWTKKKSWEGTYGPVDKNFVAYIKCSVPDYKYDSEIHGRIYISREKEPFVIKAEGYGKYSLNLQAAIDFY